MPAVTAAACWPAGCHSLPRRGNNRYQILPRHREGSEERTSTSGHITQSTLIMTPQMIGNKTSLCLKSRPFRCNKDKIKFRNTIPSHTAVSLQPAGDSLYIKPLSSLSLVPEIYRQTIGNNFPSLDFISKQPLQSCTDPEIFT